MRQVIRKKFKQSEIRAEIFIPIDDGWEGPFYFHHWGSWKGDTLAILENVETGEVSGCPPGHIKFTTGPKPE